MRNRSAFTLIELLVVIAIIAILAAILFPVFAQAKAAAKKAACISNHKEMALAAIMYSGDYDDMQFPRYAACPSTGPVNNTQLIWPGLIQPYVKNQQLFLCTAAANGTKYAEQWADRGWPSIGQNGTMGGWYWPTPDGCGAMILSPLTLMPVPAKSVMFGDSAFGDTALGWRGYLVRNDLVNAITTAGFAGSMSDRHQMGEDLALFDGHAKWYRTVSLLANPAAPYQCDDTSVYTGLWYLDKNAAKLKWNLVDPCIQEP